MILCIVGPTGIGKSEVALQIGRRLPAEVVVVDSMQVYRGMDLGTGKPDSAVREEVPHHGLDLVDPEEEFNVARYRKAVLPALASIQARGKRAVLVGGSGLYLRALLDGLCRAPGEDPAVRAKLFAEGKEQGPEALHKRLYAADRQAAARIHPNDLKRVVRALEVFRVTGRPLSEWQEETTEALDRDEGCLRVGLTCDRNLLYRRIERRIDGWLKQGWLEEAKGLHARPLSRTARGALGYRELFDFLEGNADWETTLCSMKRHTRRYAKRQWSWFRQDSRIRWIQTDGVTPEAVAERVWNEPSWFMSA